MCLYRLTFVLIGMPEKVAAVISGLELQESFTLEVKRFLSFADIPENAGWPSNSIVIINDESDWSEDALKEKFGHEERIILCTAHTERLTEEMLDRIFLFWPLPLTEAFVRHEGGRLLKQIREEENWNKTLILARTDSLTGLYNRNYFNERMQQHRKNESIALCYIDLDCFKAINDTYGHKVGDEVLVVVSNLLKETFKDCFITRMGGDEFVVVMFDVNNRDEVRERIDSFMKKTLDTFRKDIRLKDLSVSIGIDFSTKKLSLEELLRRSDAAMYWSKEHGRNRYTFYKDICNRKR